MQLYSPAFESGKSIPGEYTCMGADISPQLNITDIPDRTETLALIMDDPDAPMGTFVHWVMYDIPVTASIAKNTAPGSQGINDFRQMGYGGPCPPSGTHRYFFKLYALDRKLALSPGMNKHELTKAMEGHILDRAELMGRFSKTGA